MPPYRITNPNNPDDSLATLLGLQQMDPSVAPPPIAAPDVSRNNARTALLMKALSVPTYDPKTDQGFRPGEISQADLESTYGQVQAEQEQAEREKAQLATLPEQVKGQQELQKETAKGQTELAKQRLIEEGAASRQQSQQQAAQEAAESQRAYTQGLLDNAGGGGGRKPGGLTLSGVNAAGNPTFKPAAMPAMIQRAHDQLLDARNKTDAALAEAEKRYPGVSAAAQSTDQRTSAPSWFSFLTGGAGKYGGALDMAGAANDRAKYALGIPTPFANLAQESSFGNIEQMAGQLPGVRGLANIVPLFREHQSRWGHETPAATVQRLQHMRAIMNDTLNTIESGGVNSEAPATMGDVQGYLSGPGWEPPQ